MVKIFLDAGHGGRDSGATANGIYEKNITLDLAKRIAVKLSEYKNVQVMQTRTSDIFLELIDRTNKANEWGADCFVSLHCNAATAISAKGFESFIYNGNIDPATIAFQNVIHQEIIRQIGSNVGDRGKKRANFHVLRETKMIAILTENLFISNPSDAALLKQSTFLDRVAQGHVIGLEKFYGLVKEIRPPVNDSPQSEKLYQVIAGTFSSRENAESQVKKLKSVGYSAYIQEKE